MKSKTSALFSLLAISALCLEAVGGFVRNSASAAYINAALVVVLVWCISSITNISFAENDLFSGLGKAYGHPFASALMIVIFCLTIWSAAVRLDMFSRAVGEFVLDETPLFLISAVFAVCAFFVSYMGIEAISRYSLAALTVVFAFLIIIFASSSSQVCLSNICPVLGKGGFGGVFGMMYIFADLLYAYLGGKNGGKTAKRAIVCAGIAAFALTLFYTLCVAYPVSESYAYPVYALASFANSSVIFQRLDGLVFVIWMLGGFVTVGALCLFASRIPEVVFGLGDRRALSGAIALLVFLVSSGAGAFKAQAAGAMTVFTFAVLPLSSLVCKIRCSIAQRRQQR